MADDVLIHPVQTPETPMLVERSHEAPSFRMHFAVGVTFIGAVVFGFTLGFPSPVTNPPRCGGAAGMLPNSSCDTDALDVDAHLSSEQVTWFAAFFALGVGLGSTFAGYVADRLGKRRGLLVAHAFFLIGYMTLVAAPGVDADDGDTSNGRVAALLFTARALMGVGGGFVLCCTSYQEEIATRGLRKALQCSSQVGCAVGLTAVYALGLAYGWRELCCIAVFVIALALICCAVIAESPLWLVSKGLIEEAEAALKQLRSDDSDITDLMSQLLWHQNESIDEERARGDMKELFKRKERKRALAIGVALMVFQALSGGMVFASYGGHILAEVYPVPDSNRWAVMGHGLGLAGTLLGAAGLLTAPRKLILAISCFGMALACALMCARLSVESLSDSVYLAGFVLYCTSYSFGLGLVPWSILQDIFHPKVRGTGVALCVSVFWLLSTGVIKTLYNLAAAFGGGPDGLCWLLLAYGACTVIGGVFVVLYVPETYGRSYLSLTRSLLGYD